MARVITLAFRLGIGTATGHLVNTSIMVRIHWFPADVSMSGPTMSIATVWFGMVANTASVIPCRIGRGVLRFLHPEQLFTQRYASCAIPGQKKNGVSCVVIRLW